MVSQLNHRKVQLIRGPMDVPVIGRRIAFVTDTVGTVIELSGPLTSSPGEQGPDNSRGTPR